MVFAERTRKNLKEENPDLSYSDISKKVKELWDALEEVKKKEFNDLAALEEEEKEEEEKEEESSSSDD